MSSISPSATPRPRTGIWGAALIAGVAIVLVAQFVLDTWADGNETVHWLQHGLLFWGGVMTGASALRLFQLGSRPA